MTKPSSPSFAAILAIAAVLFFGYVPNSNGQCTQCVYGTDNSCTNQDVCVTQATCTRVQFTASCTATYTMRAETECDGNSDCANCHSCVNLYEVHGTETFLTNCHNDNCDNEHECIQNCTYPLVAGKVYAIYICKEPCPNGSDCGDCGEDCKSIGCIYYPSFGTTPCQP